MYKSNRKDIWRVFREHHYLTQDFNKGSQVYLLYWNDTLVGFNSFLNMPSGTNKWAIRTHRLVILPDFQGLGLGTKFQEFMGEYFLNNGYKLFIRTTHLRLGNHCTDSKLWKASSQNQTKRPKINEFNENTTQGSKYKKLDGSRVAYSFEYVGKDYNEKEHQIVVCDGETTYDDAKDKLSLILEKDKFPIVLSGIADQSVLTIWEQVARDMGIRTEVLYIKAKGEYNVNKAKLKGEFDAIVLSREGQIKLKPFADNIKKCISINFKVEPNKNFINF